MELKVRNIDFNYDNDNEVTSVNVRFDSYNGANVNEAIAISGHIKITKAEYDINATDLTALATLAKAKIKEQINA